ncbi:MAG: hypothetical protein O3B41_11705 [Bacteroidetes bacterium]|nr:hypothetical protein [Bacteroidota bacterium]
MCYFSGMLNLFPSQSVQEFFDFLEELAEKTRLDILAHDELIDLESDAPLTQARNHDLEALPDADESGIGAYIPL